MLQNIQHSIGQHIPNTTKLPDETCGLGSEKMGLKEVRKLGVKRDSWLTNGSEKGALKR